MPKMRHRIPVRRKGDVRVTPSGTSPIWRSMTDAERAIAYSPSSVLHGPLDPYIAAYREESQVAYDACPDVVTRACGPKPANSLDIVVPPGAEPVPLHLFIHGGYWQELSKRESFFLAPDTVNDGTAFAALDYTLAPHATLDEIVAECTAALRYVRTHAPELNIDPGRIIVSGSSAGAHLAAMATLQLPSELRPAGLILLSGVYDLEPLLGTYINDAVRMDATCARLNSPAFHDLSNFPHCVLAWGDNETDEFKRQSLHMAELLRKAGRPVDTLEVPGRNHFDVVFDLKPDARLGGFVSKYGQIGQSE